MEILENNLKTMPLGYDLDLEKIVKMTKGLSGRDIKEKILKTSLHNAISQDSDTGIVFIKGGQKSKTNSDYLEIDGTLTVISPLHLRFEGEITTCVYHINDGKPVKRKGTYNFTVAGQRRYWRMQETNNPKDGCCDYVDIYFD
jgi:SpoVK/Ycf46/Vps4 family AAA+-type ATPase